MAKTPSDKLHRLICALTPAEKRYFRIFIRGKTERDSKYFLLFEVLEAAIIYDSPAVQQAVYGGEKVTTKKYTELKAYLYDLILKALESFDEQQSVESRVQHLLKGVATLFKRGHYDDCEELLHKAQKITEKYELFNPQLDIFKWRRQLAYTRMDVHFLHHHLDLLDFEEAQILRKLNNLMAYRKTFFSIYSFIKKDAFQRDGNRMAALKIMLPESLFDSSEMALSIRAHILYLRTINLYYYAIQDIPLFYDSGKNLVELIENQPFLLHEMLSDYIASLSNLILASGLSNDYSMVRKCLKTLRQITPVTEDDKRKIHRQYYSSVFALCQYTGAFDEAIAEITRCQQEAEMLQSNDYETSSFYFQYFYIYFGAADYESALHWLNAWMALPRSVEREDLQSLARILGLITHYELENMLLLDSLIRAAKRYLKQKNRLYLLENQFIHLMTELVRAPAAEEKKEHLRKFLMAWGEMEGARSLNQIFDLKSWLEAKYEQRPFAVVVRTNSKAAEDRTE